MRNIIITPDNPGLDVVEKRIIVPDEKALIDKSLKNFKLNTSIHGTFHSRKMNRKMEYANNMELLFLRWLDYDPRIAKFFQENLEIPYYLSGNLKNFYPDFEVYLKEGHKEIWELKSTGKDHKTRAKSRAAIEWAKDHGYDKFKIINRENMKDHIENL